MFILKWPAMRNVNKSYDFKDPSNGGNSNENNFL
jgi:hypothetical protein